jgi:hypothetical protein
MTQTNVYFYCNQQVSKLAIESDSSKKESDRLKKESESLKKEKAELQDLLAEQVGRNSDELEAKLAKQNDAA